MIYRLNSRPMEALTANYSRATCKFTKRSYS